MAQWNVLRVPKLSDSQICNILEAVIDRWKSRGGSVNFGGNVTLDLQNLAEIKTTIGDGDTTAIVRADFHDAGERFTLGIRRGICHDIANPDTGREGSPYFDEILLRFTESGGSRNTLTPAEAVELSKQLASFYAVPVPGSGEAVSTATDVLQTQFNQLNTLFGKLVKETDTHRKKLDSEYEERKSALEAQNQISLDALNAKFAASQNALETERSQLEARKRELDDRDHMHARRQLREGITTDIKTRLSKSMVPRTAGYMRWSVLFLSLAGATSLGVFALLNITGLTEALVEIERQQVMSTAAPVDWFKEIPVWIMLTKGTLATAGSLAFLLYSIGWLRHLYQQDVRAHRDFERYAYDVDRASWAIETIMEAHNREGTKLPDSWVEGVTRNLFQQNAETESSGGNEALAALLAATARAEFGPGGAKFEVNGRGAKKLAHEIADT